MAADSSRILDLRRRVQADPSSIAFAHLAEELRRVGAYDEAVGVCRAGLARHPGYLSARVTLGRTLIELGQLDDAAAELETVIATAPDNLAAIRGLAEIFQRRGALPEALAYYKRALELARHDPDLEEAVDRIAQAVQPAPPAPEPATAERVEALFDFDRLLEQLDVHHDAPVPPAPAAAAVPPDPGPPAEAAADAAPAPKPPAPNDDPLAALEESLRAREAEPVPVLAAAGRPTRDSADDRALRALDGWLAAITVDRA